MRAPSICFAPPLFTPLPQGNTFTHASLPGLQADQPSLLLHTTPGTRHLLQVTRQAVALLSPLPEAAAVACWQPPAAAARAGPGRGMPCSSISQAAAHGRVLAVATASHVFCLEVCSGANWQGKGDGAAAAAGAAGGGSAATAAGLRLLSSMELPHQVSALHVCDLAAASGVGSAEASSGAGADALVGMAVVMGYWLRNQVGWGWGAYGVQGQGHGVEWVRVNGCGGVRVILCLGCALVYSRVSMFG